ncbi:unnamed protein product, partial [Urochloa humidicola]
HALVPYPPVPLQSRRPYLPLRLHHDSLSADLAPAPSLPPACDAAPFPLPSPFTCDPFPSSSSVHAATPKKTDVVAMVVVSAVGATRGVSATSGQGPMPGPRRGHRIHSAHGALPADLGVAPGGRGHSPGRSWRAVPPRRGRVSRGMTRYHVRLSPPLRAMDWGPSRARGSGPCCCTGGRVQQRRWRWCVIGRW